MTVRAYIRVSTSAQTEGFSLAAQRTKCEAWAAYQNLGPIKIYEDAGISGSRNDRPGLSSLLMDLQKGDVVVAYALSRLARGGAVQLLGIVRNIQEKGARVVFLQENIDTETSTGRLMLTILAGLAELEVEQTRERSALGKTQAALMGIYPQNPKTLPMGWKKGENGRLVESKDADTVRFIIKRGKASYQSTATLLNEQGIPTRDGKIGGWEVFQVQRVIANEGYWRGEVVYRGKATGPAERVVIPAPPLVTREEWEAAQRDRTRNSIHKMPALFPLTGHLRCLCGGRLFGAQKAYMTQREGRKTYPRYMCSARGREGHSKLCPAFNQVSISFLPDALHQEARQLLADLLCHPQDPAYIALAWQDEQVKDPYATEREILQSKLDALVDLYLEELIDKPSYESRRAEIQKRLALLTPRPSHPVANMPPSPELARLVMESTNEEFAELLDLLEVQFRATSLTTLELSGYKPLS